MQGIELMHILLPFWGDSSVLISFLGNPVQGTDPARQQWLCGFGDVEWKYLQRINSQTLLNPKVRGYTVLLLVKSLEKDITSRDVFQVSSLKPISGNYFLVHSLTRLTAEKRAFFLHEVIYKKSTF